MWWVLNKIFYGNHLVQDEAPTKCLYTVIAIFSFCYYTKVGLLFREGNGNPLQYSCLESPMDGGAWWAAVHGVLKSRTRLSDFPFTFHFHALEKEMATHSSVFAWRIPGTGEPGGLPSMGSHRVGHDWSDLAAAAVKGPHSIFSCGHPSFPYTIYGKYCLFPTE